MIAQYKKRVTIKELCLVLFVLAVTSCSHTQDVQAIAMNVQEENSNIHIELLVQNRRDGDISIPGRNYQRHTQCGNKLVVQTFTSYQREHFFSTSHDFEYMSSMPAATELERQALESSLKYQYCSIVPSGGYLVMFFTVGKEQASFHPPLKTLEIHHLYRFDDEIRVAKHIWPLHDEAALPSFYPPDYRDYYEDGWLYLDSDAAEAVSPMWDDSIWK